MPEPLSKTQREKALTTPYQINQKLIVETPENIFLEYELAGLGSRFIAFWIDTLIQIFSTFVLIFVLMLIAGFAGALTGSVQLSQTLQTVFMVIALFILYQGYYIFFEVRWKGQSPGKRLMKLRVISENGIPVTFYQATIRNILRIIDMLPPVFFIPSYGLGSLTLMVSQNSKRIGDYAAGTLVIKEQGFHGFEIFASVQTQPAYTKKIQIPLTKRIQGLDYYLLREFFFRKNTLQPELRQRIVSRLASHIRKKLNIDHPDSGQDARFLDDLMLLIESKKR
jgi:uncharacterized RDD family membrane protein YckC